MTGPFDHPLLTGLLGGHEEVRRLLGATAELDEVVRFEVALAEAEAECGVLPVEVADAIRESLQGFVPNSSELESGAARDGLYLPALVKALKAHVGEPHGQWVHYGATSQDAVDTALVLRLKEINRLLSQELSRLLDDLAQLDEAAGDGRLMGVTRMQDALPMRVSDRIASWREPLEQCLVQLEPLNTRLLVVQLGGPVGTLDKLGDDGPKVRAHLAELLQLWDPGRSWHGQRTTIAEYAGWLSLVTGALGKLGQDAALMALRGDLQLKSGGGSSAMPHKQNPVDAEALVTLARFNATQVSGMHQALVHEMERSGAAWALEWMILPQMVMACSAGLVRARHLLSNIEILGQTGP